MKLQGKERGRKVLLATSAKETVCIVNNFFSFHFFFTINDTIEL